VQVTELIKEYVPMGHETHFPLDGVASLGPKVPATQVFAERELDRLVAEVTVNVFAKVTGEVVIKLEPTMKLTGDARAVRRAASADWGLTVHAIDEQPDC
jgi:hypothetical protein